MTAMHQDAASSDGRTRLTAGAIYTAIADWPPRRSGHTAVETGATAGLALQAERGPADSPAPSPENVAAGPDFDFLEAAHQESIDREFRDRYEAMARELDAIPQPP